jgi:hypothetical protein
MVQAPAPPGFSLALGAFALIQLIESDTISSISNAASADDGRGDALATLRQAWQTRKKLMTVPARTSGCYRFSHQWLHYCPGSPPYRADEQIGGELDRTLTQSRVCIPSLHSNSRVPGLQ